MLHLQQTFANQETIRNNAKIFYKEIQKQSYQKLDANVKTNRLKCCWEMLTTSKNRDETMSALSYTKLIKKRKMATHLKWRFK